MALLCLDVRNLSAEHAIEHPPSTGASAALLERMKPRLSEGHQRIVQCLDGAMLSSNGGSYNKISYDIAWRPNAASVGSTVAAGGGGCTTSLKFAVV